MPHFMNEDRELIRNIAREFAEKEVRPLAAEIDRNETFPVELFKRCGELGFTSINVPEEYGGSGIDLTTFSIVIEEISKECATLGMCLIAHAALAVAVVAVGGSEQQKQKWLTPMASGEKIAAYCMTEPSGNADQSTWTCTATQDGDEYVINGTKIFCTNIGVSDYYIVKTVTGEYDPAAGAGNTYFMVEKGTPGFTVGKLEDKVGWRGSATGTLYFKNVRVPAENMIGPFNQANTAIPHPVFYEMTSAGACALGIAEKAYSKTHTYTLSRVVKSGLPFYFYFETMRTRIGEMKMNIEAMRSLIYNQTTMVDNGEIDMPTIIMVKPYCFKAAENICSVAIDLHGGVGVVKETGVEQLWRDAKVGMIGGGQYDNLIDMAALMLGMGK
ncbi:MAG TPA: acyl-CoA dehydrogenase family protein [Syntrophomonas sp.]|nr:acyl-CoA dehydrogenase family protein [Syntrophomonas sp.]